MLLPANWGGELPAIAVMSLEFVCAGYGMTSDKEHAAVFKPPIDASKRSLGGTYGESINVVRPLSMACVAMLGLRSCW